MEKRQYDPTSEAFTVWSLCAESILDSFDPTVDEGGYTLYTSALGHQIPDVQKGLLAEQAQEVLAGLAIPLDRQPCSSDFAYITTPQATFRFMYILRPAQETTHVSPQALPVVISYITDKQSHQPGSEIDVVRLLPHDEFLALARHLSDEAQRQQIIQTLKPYFDSPLAEQALAQADLDELKEKLDFVSQVLDTLNDSLIATLSEAGDVQLPVTALARAAFVKRLLPLAGSFDQQRAIDAEVAYRDVFAKEVHNKWPGADALDGVLQKESAALAENLNERLKMRQYVRAGLAAISMGTGLSALTFLWSSASQTASQESIQTNVVTAAAIGALLGVVGRLMASPRAEVISFTPLHPEAINRDDGKLLPAAQVALRKLLFQVSRNAEYVVNQT